MKYTLKKTIIAALFGSTMLMAGQQTAKANPAAADGKASVNVTMPEFVILHYISTVNLDFQKPKTGIYNEGEASYDVTWDGTASGSNGLTTANINLVSAIGNDDNVTVTIPNVWAVQGLTDEGSVTVNITANEAAMNNGESKITMKNLQLQEGSNTAKQIAVKLKGLGSGNASIGNVVMDLDLSKTTRTGTHTNGSYTIAVESI